MLRRVPVRLGRKRYTVVADERGVIRVEYVNAVRARPGRSDRSRRAGKIPRTGEDIVMKTPPWATGLNNREIARYRVIVRELCALSRHGWRHAKPVDYVPLERELNAMKDKVLRARAKKSAATP